MSKTWQILTGTGLGLIILVLVLARWMQPAAVPVPPVLGTIPDFELINSAGEPVRGADLAGVVWVADFIFTTCAGPCPIMSTQLATVQGAFRNDDRLRLVSITVNPDYDTPEVLSEYAHRYGANPRKWSFLTGEYTAIRDLAVNGFKMGNTEEIIFHSTRFVLVDSHSRIRGYYLGTEPEQVERLKHDIMLLMREVG